MNAPSPGGYGSESPLDVDRVEWLAASPDAVEVRVVGRWRGVPPVVAPELLAAGRRFQPAEHGTHQGGWQARFSVPIELRPRLEEPLALRVGDAELALPAALPGPADEGAAPRPAQIVDHAVLAERRARRAEGADESLVRRAQAAEEQAATLRRQLGHVEQRLGDVSDEREAFKRELARRGELQAAVRGELAEMRAALALVRERARTRPATAEPEVRDALADLHGTVARLRSRVEELERSEHLARGEAREAERALLEARREAAELRGRVEDERRRRFEVEASLRSQLEREREELASGAAKAEAALRLQLSTQRQAFEEQVTATEDTVAKLRAELARSREEHEALEERAATERSAREAAEARAATELSVREAGELALAAREARDTRVADAVRDVVAVAATLRERFAHELGVADERAREALAAERDAFRREVDEIELGLGELRAELEGERSARRVLERELEAERERTTRAGAAAATVAPIADPEELERARTQLAAAQEELARSRRARELHAEAGTMIGNLERAGRRLREERDALERADDDPLARTETAASEPPGSVDTQPPRASTPPADTAPRVPPAPSADPEPPAEPARPLEPEPPVQPRDLTRAVTTAGSPTRRPGSHVLRPRVIPLGSRRDTPWLADALRSLAADDEVAAAELLVALLPAQAGAVPGPLAYRLAIERFGTYRVAIEGDDATLERLGPSEETDVDVRVAGSVAALAPLAAGAAGRWLRGAKVEGRLRLRRLLRARRAPVTLSDLVARRLLVDPGLVLAALARTIEPAWTKGRRFTVAFVVTGRDAGTHWLTVRDGEPVTVSREAPVARTDAIVQVAQPAFLPLLARLAPPLGERLLVLGDAAAHEQLGRWFDRVQGLPEQP